MDKIFPLILIIYFFIVSIVSYILPIVDKRKAIKGKMRIRERTLFIWAGIGGAAAMLLSMKIFRHKTKHKRFMIGLPVIIIFQILLAFGVWYLMFFRR